MIWIFFLLVYGAGSVLGGRALYGYWFWQKR
jgi:hypothetical protein